MIQCQVASQDEYECQVQKTGGLEHNEVYMNGYDISIIKQEIQSKADISKIDCIRLGHGPMRLAHRRNNPNKETLIYILLSHATEYPSV